MGDRDIEAVEQLRIDSAKVAEFKDELSKLVSKGAEKPMTFEQATFHVEKLRTTEQFKHVKSLKNANWLSKLWWDKFTDEIRGIERIEVADSDEEKLEEEKSEEEKTEAEKSDNEDFGLYIGGESGLSHERIFEMVEWKKRNPNCSFARMATVFSTREDRLQVHA